MTERIIGFSCAALLHLAIFVAVGFHFRHASRPDLPPQVLSAPLEVSFHTAASGAVAAPETPIPEEPHEAEIPPPPVAFVNAAAETPPPAEFRPLEMPVPTFSADAQSPAPVAPAAVKSPAAPDPVFAPTALMAVPANGTGAGPDDLPDLDFTGNSEKAVSAPAASLKGISPAYPYASRRRGEEGTVRLRIKVSAAGVAESVEVDQSSGYRALDRAAVAAAMQAKYLPAAEHGQPREGIIFVPVSFRLTGQRR